MSKERFELQLAWSKQLAPKVCHFAFRRRDQQPFDFIPGQFISLHWQQDHEIKRSYSIASRNNPTLEIELAASFVENGFASEKLFNMQPGDLVTASGPYGKLILPEVKSNTRLILVATGTGVTPYRSMLDNLIKSITNDALNVVVLEGVQTKEQLLYGDEFLTAASHHPHFIFRAYYSREQGNAAHEYHGYVQSAFDDLQLNPLTDTVYLCGNPNMIDQAFADLKERGFEAHAVRREKYISGK